MKKISKKNKILATLLLLGGGLFFFFNNKLEKVEPKESVSEIRQNNSSRAAREIVSSKTSSPSGLSVQIIFESCGQEDRLSCFGDGASSSHEMKNLLVWDLVSTSNKLNFGVQSTSGDMLPYIVTVDFGEGVYDFSDYLYFKDSLPELFFKNIKVKK